MILRLQPWHNWPIGLQTKYLRRTWLSLRNLGCDFQEMRDERLKFKAQADHEMSAVLNCDTIQIKTNR